MSSFDLIPEDYHQMLWWRDNGLKCLFAVGILLLLATVSYASMYYLIDNKNAEIEAMQSKKHISEQQRNALTALVAQQDKLQSYLDFLQGLRGGVPAPEMFVSIDHAMPSSGVWFQSWDFQRAGFVVEADDLVRSNGYFILLPKDGEGNEPETWKIETHMNVRGRATDHAALSHFVSQLFQQAEVNDVRILDTTLAQGGTLVNFNLVITVNNAAGLTS